MATTTAAAAASSFIGTRLPEVHSSSGRIQARFGFGKKKAPKKSFSKPTTDRPLWYPGAKAPEWLDGSLVGDYGFDPFGLGKPAEYLQFDLDSLDQNLAKNSAGDVIGTRTEISDVKSTPFQPYSEVFGLQRFRECELIHGRWAMLATLGALTVEWLTGVTWQDAGKVELVEGSSYLGQPLPFSITTLIWIEVLIIGYIEFQTSSLTLSASSPSLSPSLPQILHLPSAKTRLPIPQKSNSLKPSYLNSFPRQNKSKSIRIFFTVRSSKSSTIEYDVGTASTQFQNVNVSTESKNEFNVEEVRSPIVPSNLSPPKLSLGDQAFFLLALIACTTSAAFVGFVVAAVPTLFAMGRAAIALSKLADTASKELPGTMAAIRLSGMEISDLTLELSDLSHEIADGVSKSTQAVQAADAGIRQIGSLAREQTMLMIHERANLPDISLQPVVAGAAQKTSRAVGRAARTFMNIISRREFSSENEDGSILDSLEV